MEGSTHGDGIRAELRGHCESTEHKYVRPGVLASAQLLDIQGVLFDIPDSDVNGRAMFPATLEHLLDTFQSDVVERFHQADDVELSVGREILNWAYKPFGSIIVYLPGDRYCLGGNINASVVARPATPSEAGEQVPGGTAEIQKAGILWDPWRQKFDEG